MPKTPIPGETSPAGHPYSRCDGCGAVDDHPKHIVRTGSEQVYGQQIFHPHDTDQDEFVRYHHDCEHEWQDRCDPRTVEAASSGVRGDELRALIHANNEADSAAAASKGGE